MQGFIAYSGSRSAKVIEGEGQRIYYVKYLVAGMLVDNTILKVRPHLVTDERTFLFMEQERFDWRYKSYRKVLLLVLKTKN